MLTRRTRLQQSFIDAEALEMIRSFNLLPDKEYELKTRQGDYYITLICRMSRLLEELYVDEDKERIELCKADLLDVAKGLIVYSNEKIKDYFKGVNTINNALFIAAIYYVCQYEAIAYLILHKYNISEFQTIAGRKIHYMVCSPYIKPSTYDKYSEIEFIDQFISNGDASIIANEIERLKNLPKNVGFTTTREFIDTHILLAILKKFKQHNIWETLSSYDNSIDWKDYIQFSRANHILSFLPSQEDAIKNGLLTFDRSFCLGMSTSAGKSYIIELIIYQEIRKNPNAKIIYLAPLRSFSRELASRYRKVGKRLGFKVRSSYGGHVTEQEDADMDVAQLIIATPEAFMSVDVPFEDFSLVICDEGQIIDDESRGIEYELLLTRMRQYEHVRFLFLSAIIPNLDDVNEWMGGRATEVGNSTYRPCKQRVGSIRWDKDHYVIDMRESDSNYERVGYSIK